jgi:hypothetical protein
VNHDANHWHEATEEWALAASTSDPTRPRAATALPRGPRACGCTSDDDRVCEAHVVTSEAGSVCLCLCHEGAPDEAEDTTP